MAEQLTKTSKDCVGNVFLCFWRLQKGKKLRYLRGFVRLPGAKTLQISMVLSYVGFKVATNLADPSTQVRLSHATSTLFFTACD